MPDNIAVWVLLDHDGGMSRAELLAALSHVRPGIRGVQVEQLVKSGIDAGELIDEDGRLCAHRTEPETADDDTLTRQGPLRVVAFDIESVVRQTSVAPNYTEARIFQLGGVRFGRDKKWCHERRVFNEFVELPDETWEIYSGAVRERYEERKRPAVDVLEEFCDFVRGADVLVAYNGTGVDFSLLSEALRRAEVFGPDAVRYVDGYYIALALWPTPPRRHRLADLAERVGAKASRLHWHDALDDSILLSRLLAVGARQFARRSNDLKELIASATVDSPAWELVIDLAGGQIETRSFSDAEVAAVLGHELSGMPRRRNVPADDAADPTPLVLPSRVTDSSGHVSPFTLANITKGGGGEPRPSQEDMTNRLREWVSAGHSGLMEAPTGTGKSYAMLANALEWLAASQTHRVIIATFTKQLQSQLAEDIQTLAEGGIPALASIADLVKGKANRLSLRALTIAVADCTTAGQVRFGRRGRFSPFAAQVGYQELVAFLALRILATATLSESWEGQSVDSVDIPPFFETYLAGRRNLYLASLSQASGGEYPPSADEVSLHTDTVIGSLSTHRLIIANHALLLANLEDLGQFGSETLLLIDEAHMLEDAATSALNRTFDYAVVEQAVIDVDRYVASAPSHPHLAEIGRLGQDFERFLDSERLPGAAMTAFDDGTGEPGQRVMALASPRGGSIAMQHTFAMASILRDLRFHVRSISQAMFAYQGAGGLEKTDRFAQERFHAALSRVVGISESIDAIVSSIEDVIGPPPRRAEISVVEDSGGAQEADEVDSDEESEEEEIEEVTDESAVAKMDRRDDDDGDAATDSLPGSGELSDVELVDPTLRVVRKAAPNHVVWSQETGSLELAEGRRKYRFQITSSPISLGAEESWRLFLTTFARTYYISATLTVAGTWDYITSRLGLASDTPSLTLESPFDLAQQALLVGFSDFPSWAEQQDQAMRSVAWQLGGYAEEAISIEEAADNGSGTVFENGVMVLTTSKKAASEIGDQLEEYLAARGSRIPVRSAILHGNQRVVSNFKTAGGILVGTRGLWQGVDIDDPRLLRLVWINKLPFAPFADPIVAARRALVVEQAEDAGAEDPDQVASETYYLPLAAISLRQAVGRLVRTSRHRGVVVISDSKLAGVTRQRQSYRRIFLGSLDPGLLIDDPDTGEPGGGNVVAMTEGWERIWSFMSETGVVTPSRRDELCTTLALEVHTLLPETRAIRELAMDDDTESRLRAQGAEAFRQEFLDRCAQIGALLRGQRAPLVLRDKQREALEAIADGKDVLAVLPTGYGKSFAFQLPALVLPGVTIVVSPLVSLMQDQATELNRSIGGAVRALVTPLTDSNSRSGKAQVADALKGRDDHGIRLVYLSPEKLCTRQFQELVREGVERGIVRRIAIDEAHTSVQWGDDFRPAFRRVEHFLSALRTSTPGLAITALTATANQSVYEGLRSGLFGIPVEVSDTGASNFQFVTANPIRPELALYRRNLGAHEGPIAVAGLVEAVVAALDDHAIFYCLTVKEVDKLWAQLRDVLGYDGAHRVRRYHGRLTEAEKASVVNDFRTAPSRDDSDDFVPMIVVATSAFGLGIDRHDIRCVFVVSPPTDLAALYQQLGRAGRDGSGRPVNPGAPTNAALALGSRRGFGLAKWMMLQDSKPELFEKLAKAVLSLGRNANVDEYVEVNATSMAQDLLAEDHTAGLVTTAQSRSARVADEYRVAVVRVLASLSGLGVLTDLGDYPNRVKILPGEIRAPAGDAAEIVRAILDIDARRLRAIEISELHSYLSRRVAGYLDLADEPGGTWALIVDLHALGHLDISQAPMQSMVTGITLKAVSGSSSTTEREIPESFAAAMGRRAARVGGEIASLQNWYGDVTQCANAGLANYFRVSELPEGACSTSNCRCSTCWVDSEVAAFAEPMPAVLRAFRTHNPKPVSSTAHGRAASERVLDGRIQAMLWDNPSGLVPSMLRKVLRGDDTYFDSRSGRQRTLWPKLLHSRHRGSTPGIKIEAVAASLTRLTRAGIVLLTPEGLWRLQSHIDAQARRAQRQADTGKRVPSSEGGVNDNV